VVEPSARFEEVKIPLAEPALGLEEVSGVLGTPRWWPTGARVGVVLAHDANASMADPLIEQLHRDLTELRYLTLRFNFPFAEAERKRPDPARVLRRAYRAAMAALSHDPGAAPAHVFLGGAGLGAEVACDLAGSRVRTDGLVILGYPLHPHGKPEKLHADRLFRVVCPMLFVQGTRDRRCDLDALRRTLLRVGAPVTLHVCEEADHRFQVPRRSSRSPEDVQRELLATVDGWIQKILGPPG
jgi:hypothetical protein